MSETKTTSSMLDDPSYKLLWCALVLLEQSAHEDGTPITEMCEVRLLSRTVLSKVDVPLGLGLDKFPSADMQEMLRRHGKI